MCGECRVYDWYSLVHSEAVAALYYSLPLATAALENRHSIATVLTPPDCPYGRAVSSS